MSAWLALSLREITGVLSARLGVGGLLRNGASIAGSFTPDGVDKRQNRGEIYRISSAR
jgi:hypothetical protein